MTEDQIKQRLEEEATRLVKRSGKNFVKGDQDAPDRVFSDIPGVKNIRFSDIDPKGTLCVKTHGKVGIPDSITVKGKVYKLKELYTNEIIK